MNLIFLSTCCVCTFKCTFVSMLADFINESINFLTRFLFQLVKFIVQQYLVLSRLLSVMQLFYHVIKISSFYFGHILIVFSFKVSFQSLTCEGTHTKYLCLVLFLLSVSCIIFKFAYRSTSYHISHDSTKSVNACSAFPSCSAGLKFVLFWPVGSSFERYRCLSPVKTVIN